MLYARVYSPAFFLFEIEGGFKGSTTEALHKGTQKTLLCHCYSDDLTNNSEFSIPYFCKKKATFLIVFCNWITQVKEVIWVANSDDD